MSDRPPRPAGMPSITPYLIVKDVERAMAFYADAFGFEPRGTVPGPDDLVLHGDMVWDGGCVMLGTEGAYGGQARAPITTGMVPPVSLYVYCDDVDKRFAHAKQVGAKVLAKPENAFWGDRICRLADLDGHHWTFATNVAHFDPSNVPS